MSCTKCSVKESLDKHSKGKEPLHNPNLSSRIVYERIQILRKKVKMPSGEDATDASDFEKLSRCQKVLMSAGKSEEEAKNACGGKKKVKFVEKQQKNSMEPNPDYLSADEALNLYERTFSAITQLKLSPIKNLEDIDNTRDKLYKLEDVLWRAKHAFERLSEDAYPEEVLLASRIAIRKSILNPNE